MGDGKPVAEAVNAEVDQGANTLFSEEMANQMFTGFYPPCNLQAARFSIEFKTSDQSPANFYGDLGYGEALSSTEVQYNHIGQIAGQNPFLWKTQYYDASDKHAAGVVIGQEPLINYVPLYRDPKTGNQATQYTMDQIEECGLVKMDFLGLKTLTLIKHTVDLIKKKKPDFDINTIDDHV